MRKIYAYVVIAPAVVVLTALMGTTSLIASYVGTRENRLHEIAQFWARVLLRFSSIRLTTHGLDQLEPNRSYVLVSNHTSYMDTPVLMSGIPLQFRFLAKSELFGVPFIGTHLSRAGHFPVERDNVRASLKSMSDAAKSIHDRQVSVLVFPEGGRSPKYLRPFKDGAAYIAIKAGVAAVPVALVGTRAVLPMHSTQVNPGPVEIRIGEPIETKGLKLGDRNELSDQLRLAIARLTGDRLEEDAEPADA